MQNMVPPVAAVSLTLLVSTYAVIQHATAGAIYSDGLQSGKNDAQRLWKRKMISLKTKTD